MIVFRCHAGSCLTETREPRKASFAAILSTASRQGLKPGTSWTPKSQVFITQYNFLLGLWTDSWFWAWGEGGGWCSNKGSSVNSEIWLHFPLEFPKMTNLEKKNVLRCNRSKKKKERKENERKEKGLHAVWTNSQRQVGVATKSLTMAPDIRGPSVWELIHVTFLATRI
jgi:hypothetical protein